MDAYLKERDKIKEKSMILSIEEKVTSRKKYSKRNRIMV